MQCSQKCSPFAGSVAAGWILLVFGFSVGDSVGCMCYLFLDVNRSVGITIVCTEPMLNMWFDEIIHKMDFKVNIFIRQ